MRKKSIIVVSCLFLSIVMIVGCSSHKVLWGNEKDGFILTYRLVPGDSWHYTSSSEEKTAIMIMGSDHGSTTTVKNDFTITADKVGATELACQVIINDFSHLSASPQGERSTDVAPILGKEFGLVLSPLGHESNLRGIEDITLDMGPQNGGEQSVLNFYRDMLPDLPEKPIRVGDSWTVKGEFATVAGNLDILVKTETTHTLDGFETIDGLECLKLSTAFTGTIDGVGEQEGNALDFAATTTGSGTWYFDYKKGAFVKSESTSKIEDGTIDVSGSYTFSIPLTQETTTSVHLQKKGL